MNALLGLRPFRSGVDSSEGSGSQKLRHESHHIRKQSDDSGGVGELPAARAAGHEFDHGRYQQGGRSAQHAPADVGGKSFAGAAQDTSGKRAADNFPKS